MNVKLTRLIPKLAIVGGAALLAGCGGSSEADDIAKRFGTEAAVIQGCRDELSVKVGKGSVLWPGSSTVAAVICGPSDRADGMFLNVARYPSARAANEAGRKLSRQRLLCVVEDAVVESWMYPYFAPDEARADQVAERWAREYCRRIGGRSIGHWHAWEYSTARRR